MPPEKYGFYDDKISEIRKIDALEKSKNSRHSRESGNPSLYKMTGFPFPQE